MKVALRKALNVGPTVERLVAGLFEGIWDRSSVTTSPIWHDNRRELGVTTSLPDALISTIPTASTVGLGVTGVLDTPAASGLTNPPTSTKLSRMKIWNTLLANGTTRAFRPQGVQHLFLRPGGNSDYVINGTLAGATGNIGDLFQTPANYLLGAECVQAYVPVVRSSGATGTPTVALIVGTRAIASGTFAANANSTVYLHCTWFIKTATVGFSTLSLQPSGAAGNVKQLAGTVNEAPGSTGMPDLTTALTWSVQITGGGTSTEQFAVPGAVFLVM